MLVSVQWIFVLMCEFVLVAIGAKTDVSQMACGEHGDCLVGPDKCMEQCGCDRSVIYYYNETSKECLVDFKVLMKSLVERYNNEEKIRIEAERVFQGILVSAFLFIASAIICVISACIYCCRINYIDYRLKSDVKALATKLGREKVKKIRTKVKTDPVAESCNVLCEDAGIMVV